ncbi:glycosyltransferase family 25 protein [Kingella negevensis]|uniref:glycosyltransferase family 25 protein n=1 Tax=Kingella negevensis TaxID=1522312 RepID=UPI00254F3F2E|nr:glycosyltransferase family 25 protein [Kingella negevensis]MDK4685233.1 glycosyltransferase family 25 protein [Kingella negevensis]
MQPEIYGESIMNLAGYVINLDRMPERMARFNQHPDACFFTRVSAHDRLDLEKIPKDDLFNEQYILNRYPKKPEILYGEIACTLSHIACWKQVAANPSLNGDDYAIIAEDDLILATDFMKLLENFCQLPDVIARQKNIILLHKLGIRHIQWSNIVAQPDRQLQIGWFDFHEDFDSDGSSLYMIKKSFAQIMVNRLKSEKPYWLADIFSAFCNSEAMAICYPPLGYIPKDNQSDIGERN